MASTVELLDERSSAELPPQADEWSEWARQFVGAMLRDGSRTYVDNVDAGLGLLRVDDRLLPVVRPHPVRRPTDPMRPPADVVSPRSHYADYTQEELAKRHPRIPAGLINAGFAPLRACLALGGAERIVYVNNWLLATNPVADLSRSQIDAITDALAERYPEDAIVFRTVDPTLRPRLFANLRDAGYRMVRCRRVWTMDPRRAPLLANKNVRRDLRLIERTGYEVVDDPALHENHATRMIDLYRDLYLDKHSRLNPQYTPEFLRMALRNGILKFRSLRRSGEIDAWTAWLVHDGVMTATLIGYDRSRPQELGLYRQCMALLVAEAAQKGLPLHLSAGADHFKRMRGAFPSEEYEAIGDRHLTPRRRLPWALLAVAERVAASNSAPVSQTSSYDWDNLLQEWVAQGRDDLWRHLSDLLSAHWLERWLPDQRVERLLKTDLFDEAVSVGLNAVLSRHSATLVGIDVARRVVTAALRGSSDFAAAVADVRQTPFADRCFDTIVSLSTLDHFQEYADVNSALEELARVLKPGGVLLLTMDNAANPLIALRALLPFRFLNRLGLLPYYVGATGGPRRVCRSVEKAGLRVEALTSVLHAPRVLVVALAGWIDRLGNERLRRGLARVVLAFEHLEVLPTRYLTGHYVLIRAVKPHAE